MVQLCERVALFRETSRISYDQMTVLHDQMTVVLTALEHSRTFDVKAMSEHGGRQVLFLTHMAHVQLSAVLQDRRAGPARTQSFLVPIRPQKYMSFKSMSLVSPRETSLARPHPLIPGTESAARWSHCLAL